jgi:putative ABC transport system substrate-binding protein
MRRRQFLGLFGGLVGTWSSGVLAQSSGRRRRMAVLMNVAATEGEGQSRLAALQQGLQDLGWRVGQNLDVEYRWATTDGERRRRAAELVGLAPDILFAGASSVLGHLQQATQAIPIVFCQVTDPVGGGYVASLARPGGNTTGFAQAEYSLTGKWLELIKQVAPATRRTLVLRDPSLPAAMGQFGALQSAAPGFGLEVIPGSARSAVEIERAVAVMTQEGNGSLVVTVGVTAAGNDGLITQLALRHRPPSVFPFRYNIVTGGLMSYGADTLDQFRRAAAYVDRILKGESPAELPVQAPTKFELVINLKTAKAMAIEIPPAVLARADEVIE